MVLQLLRFAGGILQDSAARFLDFTFSMNPSTSSPSLHHGATSTTAADVWALAEPMVPARLSWYGLRARNKRERAATRQLNERTDIETFAPRCRIRRAHHSGARVITTETLFPGCLSARATLADDFRFGASNPDSHGPLRFDDHTPVVPPPARATAEGGGLSAPLPSPHSAHSPSVST